MASAEKLREIFSLIEKLEEYSFEIGPIRPPSEGGSYSLLIRVTRNCPWRLCTFCYGTLYNREKFQLRSVEEVKKDIKNVRVMVNLLKEISLKLGYNGEINLRLGETILEYDTTLRHNPYFINVFNWLYSGGKTVFLQDADSLIISTKDLAEILSYLKSLFPQVERITSYARAKTLLRKTVKELEELRKLGLSRLHVGLETGDDELLKLVNKGVTAKEHIEAGKKVIEAGIELSEYIMPGLGGKTFSKQHALNTAKVLNKINPHYIRMRTFVPVLNTPLYEDYVKGRFKLLSPHECLREIKLLIENLNVTSRVCFDHFINPSLKGNIPIFRQSYEGYKLPEEKQLILKTIDEALKIDESRFRWTEELAGTPHL
mgnify:FL=1